MRIAVLGAGAMGSAAAVLLSRHDDVDLLVLDVDLTRAETVVGHIGRGGGRISLAHAAGYVLGGCSVPDVDVADSARTRRPGGEGARRGVSREAMGGKAAFYSLHAGGATFSKTIPRGNSTQQTKRPQF